MEIPFIGVAALCQVRMRNAARFTIFTPEFALESVEVDYYHERPDTMSLDLTSPSGTTLALCKQPRCPTPLSPLCAAVRTPPARVPHRAPHATRSC